MFEFAKRKRQPGGRPPGTATGAVAKFALAGLAAMALVGVAAFFLMRHIGTNEATDNAKQVTRVVGRGIVEPALTPALMRGDPAALKRLDGLVHKRVLDDAIVRVKIWRPDGRIVYSDEPKLIGQRYHLAEDDLAVLRERGVESSVSDLSAPENRFESHFGKLLEVYLGIQSPAGKPLLFETYQRFSSIASSGSDIWLAFAPALVGALILLELVHVPLASSMARRLRRGHREREALLQRAIDSSELERRRIASDLHDGVVQRLAGTSFSLAAAADRCDESDPGAAKTLRDGAGETRQSVRELRSLLTEIYPASLRDAGLEQALADLLAPLEGRGLKTELEVDPQADPTPEQAALFFRTAQEALRNAVKHADANTVRITVGRENGHVELAVSDDGVGFDSAGAEAEGHFGMRILADLARDAGASLDVESAPGQGTTVRVETST
jgi:two-component system, NarL family, sensor kinase